MTHEPPLKYICDCGEHYSSTDALQACAANNHGYSKVGMHLGHDALLEIISRSGKQFRKYEQLHRAKETPESDEKARVNELMAEMCEQVFGKEPLKTCPILGACPYHYKHCTGPLNPITCKRIQEHVTTTLTGIAENFEMRARNIASHNQRSHTANTQQRKNMEIMHQLWSDAAKYVREKSK